MLATRPGVEWIDLDRIAWESYRPGTAAYARIIKQFGSGVVREDGSIDRARLGKIVFSDADSLDALNRIVHPAVGERVRQLQKEHQGSGTQVLLVEGALLASSPHVDRTLYDLIVWLDVPDAMRRERLLEAGRAHQADRGSASQFASSAVIIDGCAPPDEVAARVWKCVEERIGGHAP